MLTWMRTHQKTIMTWTLYLVIPSFVLLYGYGEIQRRGQDPWAVRVNGREVTASELQRMESNLREQYRRQYGDRFEEQTDVDFRRLAVDRAIRRQLLLDAAERLGFGVSDEELAQYIASFPAFQTNGRFDIRRYYYYLNVAERVPEKYFEETVRQELLQSKVISFIRSTGIRPLPETESEFKRRNERVMVEMLAFRPRDYTKQVTVDEEGVREFFKERREDYRIPEQRRIEYVEYLAEDYRDKVKISETQLKSFHSRRAQDYTTEETREAEYILYAKSNYIDDVSPTENDVRSFYERNKNRYLTERKIKVRFISFPVEEWAKKVETTTGEIEDWYERHKSQFTHPEEVRACHILLRVPADATPGVESEIRDRIGKIRQEILDGLAFDEAAKKYSQDTGSAARGGDLGFFPRGRMVAAFSDAAFSLPVGEISEPVRTVFGFHLIKVEEKKEAFVDPLPAVEDKIQQQLRREKTREAFRQFAQTIKSLEEVSKTYQIQTTDWFGRGDSVEGIDPVDVSRVFFIAGRGEVGDPVQAVFGAQKYYLVELAGDKKPRPKTLEEARNEVLKDARDELAGRQALLAAQADLDRIKAGQTTWDQVARERGVTPARTEPFARSARRIAGIGTGSGAQQFVSAVFNLKAVGDVGGPVETDRGAILVRLAAVTEPTVPEFSEVKDQVQEDFLALEAGHLAHDDAARLADEAFNTQKSLADCAEKLGVQVHQSKLFKQGGPVEPIGFQREINELAFRMKKIGVVSDVIAIRRPTARGEEETEKPIERCYVISLAEIKESYLPELGEVRDQVENDYKLVLAAKIARQKAEEALAVIKRRIAESEPISATQTVDLQALVSDDQGQGKLVDGAYVRPTGITRASIYVPGVGQSTQLRKTAFALSPGQISSVIEVRETTYSPEGEPETGDITGYYILQVVGKQEAGPVTLAQQEMQMEEYWEQSTQNLAFNAWIDAASRSAKIELNEEVIWPSYLTGSATEEEEIPPSV